MLYITSKQYQCITAHIDQSNDYYNYQTLGFPRMSITKIIGVIDVGNLHWYKLTLTLFK